MRHFQAVKSVLETAAEMKRKPDMTAALISLEELETQRIAFEEPKDLRTCYTPWKRKKNKGNPFEWNALFLIFVAEMIRDLVYWSTGELTGELLEAAEYLIGSPLIHFRNGRTDFEPRLPMNYVTNHYWRTICGGKNPKLLALIYERCGPFLDLDFHKSQFEFITNMIGYKKSNSSMPIFVRSAFRGAQIATRGTDYISKTFRRCKNFIEQNKYHSKHFIDTLHELYNNLPDYVPAFGDLFRKEGKRPDEYEKLMLIEFFGHGRPTKNLYDMEIFHGTRETFFLCFLMLNTDSVIRDETLPVEVREAAVSFVCSLNMAHLSRSFYNQLHSSHLLQVVANHYLYSTKPLKGIFNFLMRIAEYCAIHKEAYELACDDMGFLGLLCTFDYWNLGSSSLFRVNYTMRLETYLTFKKISGSDDPLSIDQYNEISKRLRFISDFQLTKKNTYCQEIENIKMEEKNKTIDGSNWNALFLLVTARFPEQDGIFWSNLYGFSSNNMYVHQNEQLTKEQCDEMISFYSILDVYAEGAVHSSTKELSPVELIFGPTQWNWKTLPFFFHLLATKSRLLTENYPIFDDKRFFLRDEWVESLSYGRVRVAVWMLAEVFHMISSNFPLCQHIRSHRPFNYYESSRNANDSSLLEFEDYFQKFKNNCWNSLNRFFGPGDNDILRVLNPAVEVIIQGFERVTSPYGGELQEKLRRCIKCLLLFDPVLGIRMSTALARAELRVNFITTLSETERFRHHWEHCRKKVYENEIARSELFFADESSPSLEDLFGKGDDDNKGMGASIYLQEKFVVAAVREHSLQEHPAVVDWMVAKHYKDIAQEVMEATGLPWCQLEAEVLLRYEADY